jgi:Asp-tRNA(Asn)/Glu-tRNA(Gln) amidotransferase A subunit family amidase
LAKLIREGQVTSVEIVKEHVTRIKERNGELNALVNLFEQTNARTVRETRGSLRSLETSVPFTADFTLPRISFSRPAHTDFTPGQLR